MSERDERAEMVTAPMPFDPTVKRSEAMSESDERRMERATKNVALHAERLDEAKREMEEAKREADRTLYVLMAKEKAVLDAEGNLRDAVADAMRSAQWPVPPES